MINIIVELSKYVILTLMIVYTLYCLFLLRRQGIMKEEGLLGKQIALIYFIDLTAFLVLYLKTFDIHIVIFCGEMMVYFIVLQLLYRRIYRQTSMLLLNNMCMLLSVGFIMQCRLNIDTASTQLLIAAVVSAVTLLVPVIIRRLKILKNLTWLYAGIGVILLAAVLVLGKTSYGAKLSLFGFQPSELIKITYVFFMAALLWRDVTFKKIVLAAGISALHVGILVLSKDLGSGVIFFVTCLVMIYVASKKPVYLGIGVGAGAVGSVAAYFLFSHVRERISAWKDPMAVYENEGYQIVQSLFAIGTGGWFGMGLMQGSPEKIPVAKSDFIFSAICEELGGIFAVCLIVVCISFFMMILNISRQIKNPFYKLIALGLGTEYAFQVFLNVGGVTKFIPLTGVTLPLVSYGGSSIVCTILVIAIIQGLYIYREDEDEEIERFRKEAARRAYERAKALAHDGREGDY